MKAVVISQNTDRVQGSMSAMGDGQGGRCRVAEWEMPWYGVGVSRRRVMAKLNCRIADAGFVTLRAPLKPYVLPPSVPYTMPCGYRGYGVKGRVCHTPRGV